MNFGLLETRQDTSKVYVVMVILFALLLIVKDLITDKEKSNNLDNRKIIKVSRNNKLRNKSQTVNNINDISHPIRKNNSLDQKGIKNERIKIISRKFRNSNRSK